MPNFLKPLLKTRRPETGDLVVVNSANEFINVYTLAPDFSFANVAFTAVNGEMGVVLGLAAEETGSILYHYVRVLFQRGMVGVAHFGLLLVLDPEDDEEV